MTDLSLYRRCAGVVLANRKGLIFTGERIDTPGAWQMPQGGIDEGEDPAPPLPALANVHTGGGIRRRVGQRSQGRHRGGRHAQRLVKTQGGGQADAQSGEATGTAQGDDPCQIGSRHLGPCQGGVDHRQQALRGASDLHPILDQGDPLPRQRDAALELLERLFQWEISSLELTDDAFELLEHVVDPGGFVALSRL